MEKYGEAAILEKEDLDFNKSDTHPNSKKE